MSSPSGSSSSPFSTGSERMAGDGSSGGADDPDTKIPAHEVTSKAVEGQSCGELGRVELTLSTCDEHEPAHLTERGSDVKRRMERDGSCGADRSGRDAERAPRAAIDSPRAARVIDGGYGA